MKLALNSIAFVSLVMAAPAAPALAQAAGTQVVDTNGGAVGTVVRVDGANVIVTTGKHEVALPKTSFTPHEGKLLFGMTQAQLNAETEKSLAAASAAVAPGATVKGTGGAVLGTIDSVDTEFVTLKLTSGELVRIPSSGVSGRASGEVVVGLTAEQLKSQVAPPESAAPSGSTASSQ